MGSSLLNSGSHAPRLSAIILSDDGDLCALVKHTLALSRSPIFNTSVLPAHRFSPTALNDYSIIFLDHYYRSRSYLETLQYYHQESSNQEKAQQTKPNIFLILDEASIANEIAGLSQATTLGVNHFFLNTDFSLKRVLNAINSAPVNLTHNERHNTQQPASSLYVDNPVSSLDKQPTSLQTDIHCNNNAAYDYSEHTDNFSPKENDNVDLTHLLAVDIENQRVHIEAITDSPIFEKTNKMLTMDDWLALLNEEGSNEFQSMLKHAVQYETIPKIINCQISTQTGSSHSATISDIQIKNNGQGRVIGASAKLSIPTKKTDIETLFIRPGFDNIGDSADLIEYEKIWENITKSLPMMCLLLDEQGYIVRIANNDEHREHFPQAEKGKQLAEALNIESLDSFAETIRRTLNTGKQHQQTIAYPGPQGMRWLDTYITKLRGDSGLSRQVVWTAFDITSTRLNYQELLKNHDALEHILDDAPVLMFQKDNSGRFQRVNKAFAHLFNVREDVIAGRNDQEVFRNSATEFSAMNEKILHQPNDSSTFQYIENMDGQPYNFTWHLLAQKRQASGQIDAVLGFGFAKQASESNIDGTDINNKEQTTDNISEITPLTNIDLSGAIGQDFKIILNSIVNYTELALAQKNKNREQKIAKHFDELEDAIKRSRSLIQGKNENSSPSALSSINLKPLIDEIVDMVKPTLPSSLIFNTQIKRSSMKALVDENIFKKIVMLLLMNARDIAGSSNPSSGQNDIEQQILLSLNDSNLKDTLCTACSEKIDKNYIALTVATKTREITNEELTKLISAAQSATKQNTDNNVIALAHRMDGHASISYENSTLSLQLLFKKS